MDPEFHHLDQSELPVWEDKGAHFRLVAGKGYGKESPLPVHSELFMIEVQAHEDHELSIDGQLQGEIGFCIVDGEITACDQVISTGNMLVSKTEDACKLSIKKGSLILLFGGEPFPEERHIFWNFVSSDKKRIEQAKEDWEHRNFPRVAGDQTYVPLP